ncbi:MAG: hypothetical protein MI685_10695 [Chlorobiales bacterium]|nr:hypothetical protein [Chlorobiales bacterium]
MKQPAGKHKEDFVDHHILPALLEAGLESFSPEKHQEPGSRIDTCSFT